MKTKISGASVLMFVMLLAVALCYFLVFVPGQQSMATVQSETSALEAEAALYQEYIADPSALEADIAALQAEIDAVHADSYVNANTVGLVVSDAIQRFQVELTSFTLGSETTIGDCNALPMNLSLEGTTEDILAFIAHFESDDEGSYLVHAASLEMNGGECQGQVVIHLCTPAA